MKHYLKYLFAPLSVLLLLCACQDDLRHEAVRPVAGDGIVFVVKDTVQHSSPEGGNTTRASRQQRTRRHFLGMLEQDSVFIVLTEDENPALPIVGESGATTRAEYTEADFTSFYVTARMDMADGTTPVWMENATIYKPEANSEETRWSGEAYWPKGDYTLHFFAHAWNVWQEKGTPITPVYTVTGSGNSRQYQAAFTYELPAAMPLGQETPANDAVRQPDLIFAITPEQTKSANPTVDLEFFHALAAVRFKWGNIPEDVTIVDATLSVGGVCTGGSCTMNHPLDSGEDFAWTLGQETATYSIEGFQGKAEAGETYMMLPQKMNDEMLMKLTVRVGQKDYRYQMPLTAFVNAFPEWKANHRYTYTISISEYVEVGIEEEEVTTILKRNVRLQNTGLSDAYLRAAIVGYWQDSDGNIIGAWKITETTTGTLSLADDWENHWELGTDGFYYHKHIVPPGEYTTVPLFDEYVLNSSTAPVEGARLIINIVAQAIAPDLLAKLKETDSNQWPFTPTTTNE